jgi:uncharacterized protein (DUF1684 family)
MKAYLAIIIVFLANVSQAQTDSVALREIQEFQQELNEEYRTPKTSPLDSITALHFTGHDFFPVDLSYRVTAILTVTGATLFFKMKTSSQKLADYRVYGMLAFTLKGKLFEVPVYQSQRLMSIEKYKDYLFFPFTDLTNGTLTYTAGRYISLSIPKDGNTLTIDFNQAYNPFCAYADGYSCPIVPTENYLDVEVLAGVKYTGKK